MSTKVREEKVAVESMEILPEEDKGKEKSKEVSITPPNFQVASIKIIGTSPYVQQRFSAKAGEEMKKKQEAGQQAQKGKKREAKDFKACYEAAKHLFPDGTCGMPAAGFRAAMISACKLVGFKMTQGKLTIFIEADGFDVVDGTSLVKFTEGKPEYFESPVRLPSGVMDLRARPMWKEGWRATIRVRFDADIFSAEDILNLLSRAGQQVGIGEGRADSRKSCGMGWGFFRIFGEMEVRS